MSERDKGKLQEAAGAVTADQDDKADSWAQQRKASAREEREQHKRS